MRVCPSYRRKPAVSEKQNAAHSRGDEAHSDAGGAGVATVRAIPNNQPPRPTKSGRRKAAARRSASPSEPKPNTSAAQFEGHTVNANQRPLAPSGSATEVAKTKDAAPARTPSQSGDHAKIEAHL